MIVRLICPPRLIEVLEKCGIEFPEKHRHCEELRVINEPASCYGTYVLLRESGGIFTGGEFFILRNLTCNHAAYIETDEPQLVANALRILPWRLDYSDAGIRRIS